VTDLAPAHRRGEAVSYFSVALYLGLALGPSLGERVLGDGHFSRVWVLAAALVVVAAALGSRVQDAPGGGRHVGGQGGRRAARSQLVHPAGLVPGAALGLGTVSFAAFAAFMPLHARAVGAGASGPVFLVFAG